MFLIIMSHINGDISRTRELLSQAVQHLDNVNTHHNPTNTTPREAGCNVPNNGSASTHVNLHYHRTPTITPQLHLKEKLFSDPTAALVV